MGHVSRELAVLNDLFEVTLDSVAGYREVAANSDSQNIQESSAEPGTRTM